MMNAFDKKLRKIAIFTDSHSLYEPTEAILEDIKRRGITEIYSLGDNVGLGPNPREVLELLEEYNVTSLAGNYEDTLNLGTSPFESYINHEKIVNMKWTKSKLNEQQLEKIRKLPHFVNLELGDTKVGLCHFSNDVRCDFMSHSCLFYVRNMQMNGRGYKQFAYTNSREHLEEIALYLGFNPESFKNAKNSTECLNLLRSYVIDNKEKFDSKPNLLGYVSYVLDPLFCKDGKLLTTNDYQLVVQGHAHFQFDEETPLTRFYSVRGAGMGYDSMNPFSKDMAEYIILEENEAGVDIEVVNVSYDREKMLNAILASESPSPTIMKYTLARR